MLTHADLVIVGAGMVGSALALALADSGLSVVLLDRDQQLVSARPQPVSAEDLESVRSQVGRDPAAASGVGHGS